MIIMFRNDYDFTPRLIENIKKMLIIEDDPTNNILFIGFIPMVEEAPTELSVFSIAAIVCQKNKYHYLSMTYDNDNDYFSYIGQYDIYKILQKAFPKLINITSSPVMEDDNNFYLTTSNILQYMKGISQNNFPSKNILVNVSSTLRNFPLKDTTASFKEMYYSVIKNKKRLAFDKTVAFQSIFIDPSKITAVDIDWWDANPNSIILNFVMQDYNKNNNLYGSLNSLILRIVVTDTLRSNNKDKVLLVRNYLRLLNLSKFVLTTNKIL